MDAVSANLSHRVFGQGARTGDGSLRSQAEGIVEKLVVYRMPKVELSNDAQLAVLAYMAAYGRSESLSPSAWATWCFSYIVMAFPSMENCIRQENDREYQFKDISVAFVTALVSASRAAEEYDDAAPEAYEAAVSAIPLVPGFPDIESDSDSFPPDLAATATVQSVYGYVSLLIYLAGKRINPKNETTITEKRPSNLVNAYKIPEQAAYSLSGDGKMSTQAHQNVNQAWVTYAHMRVAIVSEVARFSAGVSLPQRVVYTIFKLLEYAGMQQGSFIHEFLQAMPQAINYSCIRPSYNAYVTSLREVASAPAYLQPYYKLMHGERTRAFHRNSLLTLSACATAYKKYVTPSMKSFTLGEGATPAVNMYDAEAVRRGDVTLQGLTSIEPENVENEKNRTITVYMYKFKKAIINPEPIIMSSVSSTQGRFQSRFTKYAGTSETFNKSVDLTGQAVQDFRDTTAMITEQKSGIDKIFAIAERAIVTISALEKESGVHQVDNIPVPTDAIRTSYGKKMGYVVLALEFCNAGLLHFMEETINLQEALDSRDRTISRLAASIPPMEIIGSLEEVSLDDLHNHTPVDPASYIKADPHVKAERQASPPVVNQAKKVAKKQQQ